MVKKVLKKAKNWAVKKSIAKYEKTYNNLKYCFFPEKGSKTLLVVFSGFPGGNTAKYNYIRTLANEKANKLFLLDDVWNPVNVGSFYLGKNGDWYFIKDITNLIAEIVKENNIEKIITLGSSKGGVCSLLYGSMIEADACIIGAPQYYLGKYLSTEKHLPILEAIMGDTSQQSIDKLDRVVKDEVEKKRGKKPVVYIHYSPKENTYKEHIRYMLADLRANGYTVYEDNNYSYEKHNDVAKYFPDYLLRTVRELIKS